MIVMLGVCVILAMNGCDATVHAPEESDSDSARLSLAGPSGVANSYDAHGDIQKAVRQSTARFNSTEQALKAGYMPDDHCVAHPTLGEWDTTG